MRGLPWAARSRRKALGAGADARGGGPDRDWRAGWPGLAGLGLAGFCAAEGYGGFGSEVPAALVVARELGAAPGGLHLGGPPVIEMLGDDRARTTRNLVFVGRSDGASRNAVYTDELVRTPEGWRIAACRCRFITPDGLADRPPR